MELSIRAVGFDLSGVMQDLVERRIQFALARFGQRITRASCSISDLNGPRGGIDKQVRLEIKPAEGRVLVVEQTDASVVTAVDLAVDRAARGVARELQRTRERHRRLRL